jgi:hypothetical protein
MHITSNVMLVLARLPRVFLAFVSTPKSKKDNLFVLPKKGRKINKGEENSLHSKCI